MKRMYRCHFLLDIIQMQENFQKQGENISASNLLADITLKDAMNCISDQPHGIPYHKIQYESHLNVR